MACDRGPERNGTRSAAGDAADAGADPSAHASAAEPTIVPMPEAKVIADTPPLILDL
jgi:hypothetical protein